MDSEEERATQEIGALECTRRAECTEPGSRALLLVGAVCLLPVVELRNRSINSWLILVPPAAASVFLRWCGNSPSGR